MECVYTNAVKMPTEELHDDVQQYASAKEQLSMLLLQLQIQHHQYQVNLYKLRVLVESTFASNKDIGRYLASWNGLLILLQNLEEDGLIWTDVKGIVHLSPPNKEAVEPQSALAQIVSEKKGTIGVQGYVISVEGLSRLRLGYAYVAYPLRCIVRFFPSEKQSDIKEGDFLYLKIHDNHGKFFHALAKPEVRNVLIKKDPQFAAACGKVTKVPQFTAACGKVTKVKKNFCTILTKKIEIFVNLKYTKVFVGESKVTDLRSHFPEGRVVYFDAFLDTNWNATLVWVGPKPKSEVVKPKLLNYCDKTKSCFYGKSNPSSSEKGTKPENGKEEHLKYCSDQTNNDIDRKTESCLDDNFNDDRNSVSSSHDNLTDNRKAESSSDDNSTNESKSESSSDDNSTENREINGTDVVNDSEEYARVHSPNYQLNTDTMLSSNLNSRCVDIHNDSTFNENKKEYMCDDSEVENVKEKTVCKVDSSEFTSHGSGPVNELQSTTKLSLQEEHASISEDGVNDAHANSLVINTTAEHLIGCDQKKSNSNMMSTDVSNCQPVEDLAIYRFSGASGRVTELDRKTCTIIMKRTMISCCLEYSRVFVNGLQVTDMRVQFQEGRTVCFDAILHREKWKATVVWIGKKPKNQTLTSEHLKADTDQTQEDDSNQSQNDFDKELIDKLNRNTTVCSEVKENDCDALTDNLEIYLLDECVGDSYQENGGYQITSNDNSNDRSLDTVNVYSETNEDNVHIGNSLDILKVDTSFQNNSCDCTQYENAPVPRHDVVEGEANNKSTFDQLKLETQLTSELDTKQKLIGECGQVTKLKQRNCIIVMRRTSIFCYLKYTQVFVNGLQVTDLRLHLCKGRNVYFDAVFDTKWKATVVWVGIKPKMYTSQDLSDTLNDVDQIRKDFDGQSSFDSSAHSNTTEVRENANDAVPVDESDEHLSYSCQITDRPHVTSHDILSKRFRDSGNIDLFNETVENNASDELDNLQEEILDFSELITYENVGLGLSTCTSIYGESQVREDTCNCSTIAYLESHVSTKGQKLTAETGIVKHVNYRDGCGIIMKKQTQIHFHLFYTAVFVGDLRVSSVELWRYLNYGDGVGFDAIFDAEWKATLLWKGKKPKEVHVDVNKDALNDCNQHNNDLEIMAREYAINFGDFNDAISTGSINSGDVAVDLKEETTCKRNGAELTKYDNEITNSRQQFMANYNTGNIDSQHEETKVPYEKQEFIADGGVVTSVNQNSGTIMKKKTEVHFNVNYTDIYVNRSLVDDLPLFLKEGSIVCFDAVFDTMWKASLVWIGKKPKIRNIQGDSSCNSTSSENALESHYRDGVSPTDTAIECLKDEELCKNEILETGSRNVSEMDLAFLQGDEMEPKVPRYFFNDKKIIDLVSKPEKDSNIEDIGTDATSGDQTKEGGSVHFGTLSVDDEGKIPLFPDTQENSTRASTVTNLSVKGEAKWNKDISQVTDIVLAQEASFNIPYREQTTDEEEGSHLQAKWNKDISQVTDIVLVQEEASFNMPYREQTTDEEEGSHLQANALNLTTRSVKKEGISCESTSKVRTSFGSSCPPTEKESQPSDVDEVQSDEPTCIKLQTENVQPPAAPKVSTENRTEFCVQTNIKCKCTCTCTRRSTEHSDEQTGLSENGMTLNYHKLNDTNAFETVPLESDNHSSILSVRNNSNNIQQNTTREEQPYVEDVKNDVGRFPSPNPGIKMKHDENKLSVPYSSCDIPNKQTKEFQMSGSLVKEFESNNCIRCQEEQVRLHKIRNNNRCAVAYPCTFMEIRSAYKARSRKTTYARNELQLFPTDLDFAVDLVLEHLLKQRENIKRRGRFIGQRKSKLQHHSHNGNRKEENKKNRRESQIPRDVDFETDLMKLQNVHCLRLVLCFVFFSVFLHLQIFRSFL